MILGNHSEFSNLFKFNQYPVPNWISHFIFAISNLIFPDYIGEKIALGIYLILFPLFFRKIVLWFYPQNKMLSYFGVLLAHNHLLYFGFFNFVLALAFFLVTSFYILKLNSNNKLKYTLILSALFLVIYFSHVLVLLIGFVIAVILALSGIKIEKTDGSYVLSNWKPSFVKLKLVLIAMLPSFVLAFIYLLKVDSLENAKHLTLNQLLDWIVDIRPMLTLCMCKPWNIFTHILFGIILLLIFTNLIVFFKNNCTINNGKFSIRIPTPKISLVWFLVFFTFLILYLVVPNSNLLTERLILIVYIFLGVWLASLTYPKWIQIVFLVTLLTTHITFAVMHTKSMRSTSKQVEKMHEVTAHVEPGSLLLPFNYAHHHNWLHNHSPGYFGSDKPIVVIENYEAQLAWFPLRWKIEGPYNLDKINVWGANNRKLIENFYSLPDYPNAFSLPLQDGNTQVIPYVVIFGKVAPEQEESYKKVMSILNRGYSLTFENDFCKLYHLN